MRDELIITSKEQKTTPNVMSLAEIMEMEKKNAEAAKEENVAVVESPKEEVVAKPVEKSATVNGSTKTGATFTPLKRKSSTVNTPPRNIKTVHLNDADTVISRGSVPSEPVETKKKEEEKFNKEELVKMISDEVIKGIIPKLEESFVTKNEVEGIVIKVLEEMAETHIAAIIKG